MSGVSNVEDVAGSTRRIGRFELLQRLALGGMAELFLARKSGIEGFEKIVVLKRILPHLADDNEFVQMFLTEARLAATLNHANVVHVHDIGKEEGEYFFTMEYVHGEDLRRVLHRAEELGRRITLEHALTVITGVAAGLHHAHEQIGYDGRPLGIVHRDVSPSNIILTYGGGVKLADFGIAKAAARTNVSRLSTLKGKASYMSPEQCRGAKLDRRSDIFAIAIVLQEMLTMRQVYPDRNELMVMHRVASGDVPPIRDAWPQCPEDLERILSRALRRDPGERYATALEFQLDIERFAHAHRVQLSMAALGQFLAELFGTKPYPWVDDSARPVVEAQPPSLVSRTLDKPPLPGSRVVPLRPEPTVRREAPVEPTVAREPIPPPMTETVRTAAPMPPIVMHEYEGGDSATTRVAFAPQHRTWPWVLAFGVFFAGGSGYLISRSAGSEPAATDAPATDAAPSVIAPSPVPAEVEAIAPAPAPAKAESTPPATNAGDALGTRGEPTSRARRAGSKPVDAKPQPQPQPQPAADPVVKPEPEEEIAIEIHEDDPDAGSAPKPRRNRPRKPNPDPDGLLPY